MAKGSGGEVVFVHFQFTDGGWGEANMLARTWSRASSDAALSNRQWWLTVTKTPWCSYKDLAPQDGPYDLDGAVMRFGQETPWGAAGGAVEAPWQVVRCGDIDYAFGPGVFIMIDSPDMYHFLMSAHLISTPHGTAGRIEMNLLDFIRRQALRGVLAGSEASGAVTPIPGQQQAAAVSAANLEAESESTGKTL